MTDLSLDLVGEVLPLEGVLIQERVGPLHALGDADGSGQPAVGAALSRRGRDRPPRGRRRRCGRRRGRGSCRRGRRRLLGGLEDDPGVGGDDGLGVDGPPGEFGGCASPGKSLIK